MNQSKQPGLVALSLKTISVHTITYMAVGLLAFTLLDYTTNFAAPELACWMRQTDDPVVMLEPLFQPVRGLIFGLAFYPIRETLFGQKRGWLILWWLLVALGILSTFGPAPGSIEGMVYTILPVSVDTYLEITTQSLLLSVMLTYWVNNPEKRWLNWVMWIMFAIVILLPIMGLLTGSIS